MKRSQSMKGLAVMRRPNGEPYGYRATAALGSKRTNTLRGVPPQRFRFSDYGDSPEATLSAARAWRETNMAMLRNNKATAAPAVKRDSFLSDIPRYLEDAEFTNTKIRDQREQQLLWWAAQLAAVDAPVYSVAVLTEMTTRGERPEGVTLGELSRDALKAKRLRQVLAKGFAPTDRENDPSEFASTSNSYRTALGHFFETMDLDADDADNPVRRIDVRRGRDAQKSGQDMRVILEILKHTRSLYGPKTQLTALRLDVLAFVPITNKQLKAVDPAKHFHDVPNATRADILAGAITLDVLPRMKGMKGKVRAPEPIPLNPWGVLAMRAYAKAIAKLSVEQRKFSNSSLNKTAKRAARDAQASLATRGYEIDLSEFHAYHFKHSLSTAAQLAAPALVDRDGNLKIDKGLQRQLGHAHDRTTRIYTQASVEPAIRHLNTVLSLWLEQLFAEPLIADEKSALRIVGGRR